jgi:pimeloyl-ACP methyl ester carboxylesterase
LLDNLVEQAGTAENMEHILARGTTNSPDIKFFERFLMDMAANAGVTDADITAQYDGDVQERGPLNWGWVQAILKAVDGTGFSNFSLKKFTYDVYLYLTLPVVRRQIHDFVIEEIGTGPAVILAHSLGTVVTYNILQDNPDWSVAQLLTVGSPLGVKSVNEKLRTPFSMPTCVANGWFNAYDDRDVVALQPLDERNFNITPAIENYDKVRNHTSNRHGIEGYLDDAVVARAIYDALQKAGQ